MSMKWANRLLPLLAALLTATTNALCDEAGSYATASAQRQLGLASIRELERSLHAQGRPISPGIPIDKLAAMMDRRAEIGAAALQLAGSSNRLDDVFIVDLENDGYLDAPFTRSAPKLESAAAGAEAASDTITGALGGRTFYRRNLTEAQRMAQQSSLDVHQGAEVERLASPSAS
jgi:hypothetical protein